MAKYSVQGPDGRVYVLEGPDGASQDDVLKAAQSLAQAHQQRAAADYAKFAAEVNPTNDMGTIRRWLAGTGKGMTDLARGAGERLGLVSPEDIAQSRQDDAPLMATTAGKVGNITGKIAPALPAMFIPGANTLVGSTVLGATQGALEPTTADESVLKNIAIGGAGGAAGYGAGKVVGAAVKTGIASAEPFFAAGQQRIVGRALNTAAGDAAPAVVNRLQEAAQPAVGPFQPGMVRNTLGEMVPGSVPTVGQAAQNPGIAALERAATATQPDVTNAVTARLAAQNAARTNALSEMAGEGGGREFAAANRDATADQLFGQAFRDGVPSLTPAQLANVAGFQARVPAGVQNYARELAQIKGMPMDDTTALQGLHWTKKALDALISKEKGPTADATLKAAYTGLKNDLVDGMGQLNPEYAAASSTYRQMSEPINQMDVAQALLDRARNPLTEMLQPAAYARALTDKTAATATGFGGATLDNTMSNQQNNALQAILADMQRATSAQNAGRGVGSDTVQKLAYNNILTAAGGDNPLAGPGLLKWAARTAMATPGVGNSIRAAGGVAARAGDAAYGRQNTELARKLAETMLNSGDAAQAMSAAAKYDEPNALLQLLAPYVLRLQASAAPATALSMSR